MDNPNLPRQHDFNESKDFLGLNTIIAIIAIIFLFIVARSWYGVYDEIILRIFGRKPTLVENIFLAIFITIVFVFLVTYVFRVSLVSFA